MPPGGRRGLQTGQRQPVFSSEARSATCWKKQLNALADDVLVTPGAGKLATVAGDALRLSRFCAWNIHGIVTTFFSRDVAKRASLLV